MMIIVGIVVVVVVVLFWFIRQSNSLNYLLQAKVVAKSSGEYSVTFNQLHPDMVPVEYIWLCLQLAPKLLYNIGNDPNQAKAKQMLMSHIALIGRTDISGDVDLVKISGRPIRVNDEPTTTGKAIVAKLAYVNSITRIIQTSLPLTWFEYQFPDTFLAVVHMVIPRLDPLGRKHLQKSLARMAEIYAEGADSSTLSALGEVPSRAFIEAM